jgi:hypothetical protein
MPNNIRTPVFIILIFSFFSSCSQNKPHKSEIYTIDSSIVSEIDRKTEPFKGKYNANISFAVYENEKEVVRNNDLPALSFTSFANNIVAVDCLNGIDNGFGFFLMIGKDNSFVNLKVLSKSDSILFRQANDSTSQPELLVNSVNRKVILAHKPSFNQGEVIQGFVELESDYFHEVRNSKERKIKFWIKAFFKSEPIPVNKNQYKTLVK